MVESILHILRFGMIAFIGHWGYLGRGNTSESKDHGQLESGERKK